MERMGGLVARFGFIWLVLTGSLGWAQEKATDKPRKYKTLNEKAGYAVGRDLGQDLAQKIKSQKADLDLSALIQGIEDALRGTESRVPDAELKAAMKAYLKRQREKVAENRVEEAKKRVLADPNLKAIAEANAEEETAYLKENKAKKGVKTTASGLQYEILKEGKGKKPKEGDRVEVHYHGTFPNDESFDSSVDRMKPVKLPVSGVIDGWKEALQMMPVGAKWRLVIPSHLAYSWSGSGPEIGPNQLLIFEVELLGIEAK